MKWDALIRDFYEHIGKPRCENAGALHEEIKKLRKQQDDERAKAEAA